MRIAEFSVKNYQFTIVIFVMVLFLGISSLLNMPRGEDPPFKAPIFVIVAVYPGTSPGDMEQLVAEPLEDVLYELDEIKNIKTTCDDGLLLSRVEFRYGVDLESKNNDIIREINRIRPELPDGIIAIEVEKASSADVAILQAALVSPTASSEELQRWAEKLEVRLEKIKDLQKVEASGYPEQEVEVKIHLDKLAQHGVGLNRILGMIDGGNVNIPGGDLDINSRTFNVKTNSDFANIADLQNLVVNTTSEGRVVYLKDIADVRLGYAKNDYRTRFNGERTAFVIACLKERKNIIQASEKMYPVLEEFAKELPPHIRLERSFDQPAGVKKRLASFAKDFAIAILLVLITLVPLGWRAAVVVMISIPLSLSIGLTLLDFLGFTINQLSIVGLVVALGLLVDDSIVVVENIERFLRMGYKPKEAAVAATKQIGVAVIGCTATLIFAFLPLTFLPEGSGDFIRSLPMAVLVTVLASLFVAVTIIPFLSSLLLKPHESSEGNFFLRAFNKYINAPYHHVLTWAFKHPVLTLAGTFAIFLGSLALTPLIGFSVFPKSEKPMLMVNVETPLGTNLDETDRVVQYVEQKLLRRMPAEVSSVSANIGKGNPRVYYNTFQKNKQANYAQLLVQLRPDMHMPEIDAFADTLRNMFADYPGAKIQVKQFEQGPPTEAPIEFRLLGENLDTLRGLGAQVEKILSETEGTMYVDNPLLQQKMDIKVTINKDKAGLLGIPVAEVARTVRMVVAGLNVGEFRTEDGEEYNINLSMDTGHGQAVEAFSKTYITSLGGALVPLSQIAQIEMGMSPSVIRHLNKERFTTVSCFVKSGYNVNELTEQLIKKMDAVKMPAGYSYVAAGEREASQESFGGMGTIVLIAMFGLLAILVLEFRNFKSTLIVLSVIPLGTIGAFITLFLVGKTLSFVAVVGLIALVGIEIKNSILLVDYTNQLRAEGMPLEKAILEGAETRFLPILLTTMTAIGGFIPLVLEDAPLYAPLAWVLIGGLISSTLLSRLVTPLLYKLLPPSVDVKEV